MYAVYSTSIKYEYKLDIDCVLERTRGMLAEVTFDPTGQF